MGGGGQEGGCGGGGSSLRDYCMDLYRLGTSGEIISYSGGLVKPSSGRIMYIEAPADGSPSAHIHRSTPNG